MFPYLIHMGGWGSLAAWVEAAMGYVDEGSPVEGVTALV